MNRFKIEGMDNLIDTIKRLEKLPQKHVTAAAKSGAQIALKAAKAKAPGDPGGNLKKGIILKGEKKSKNGKKIYDVMMDPAMNDIFVKESNGKRYYYPASMEFGFITKKGQKTAGHHFLRDALVDNYHAIVAKTIETLSSRIDKELGR